MINLVPKTLYDAALLLALGSALGGGAVYVATRHRASAAKYEVVEDSWDKALSEGRVKVENVDGAGSDEVVYRPRVRVKSRGKEERTYLGAPSILTQVGDSYSESAALNGRLAGYARRLSEILGESRDPLQLKDSVAGFGKSVPEAMQPLVLETLLDPRVGLLDQARFPAAYSAVAPLLAQMQQLQDTSDLLASPQNLLATFGAHFVDYLAHPEKTRPMTYAEWTKSGPGWEGVGKLDPATGMVKVSPGTLVSPSNAEAIKQYEQLRNDPNVSWTAGGPVRNEIPVGMTRRDYDTQTEREQQAQQENAARAATADAQRRQFEQNVQNAAQGANNAVQGAGQAVNNFFQSLQQDRKNQKPDR